MKEFIHFVKHPKLDKIQKVDFTILLKLFIFYIITSVFLGVISAIVTKLFNLDHTISLSSPYKTILIGVFLAPIYEELLFRSLLRLNKLTITFFLTTLICLTIISFINNKYSFFYILLSVLLISLTIVWISKLSTLKEINKNYFSYSYYFSSLLFGLIHLFNFSGDLVPIIAFALLLVSPQIILGLILGFIRIKFGLAYAILFHAIINLSIVFTLFK